MKRQLFAILAAMMVLVLAACGQQTTPQTSSTDAPAATEEGAAEAPAATEEEAATEEAAAETEEAPAATQAPATTSAPAGGESAQTQPGGRLETIISRGTLICGVNDAVPGFGSIDASGNFSGFDVDFCKAIAAAVLDDPEAVEYRPLTSQERFTAVQTGEVDVLIRNTTWTLSRDGSVGLDFAPITFYDGQGMLVRKDLGITTLEELDGATICVQTGTTTELNLADNFRSRNISFTPLVFQDADQTFGAYDAGQCDGVTTDKSGLVSRRTTLSAPDDHVILDVTMSKEPLGPSVLQGDAQWADAVRWITFATIQAEEFGITQDNIGDFANSEDPSILRFLGTEGELGDGIGLPNDFAARVVTAVGNYGEIYDRNLGPETPFELPRGQNSLYTTEGGLLYSPPFR